MISFLPSPPLPTWTNTFSYHHYQRTQWTYPSYCSKFTKMSTNLGLFEQYLKVGVSSDLFADTGHKESISCSTIQYTNPFFSIFGLISCVKSVLNRVKHKTIKKFYWSEGMSTRSSVSSSIIIIIMNLLKNNNKNKNNDNYNDVKERS
jgi:hypothetical protein